MFVDFLYIKLGWALLMTLKCKKRDDDKCVLTGWEEPDAVHIYPHCLIKVSGREPRAVGRSWDILGLFLEEDRVEQRGKGDLQ